MQSLPEGYSATELQRRQGTSSTMRELTTGILDQIARYERLKIAERSRTGKLRKAREGKVIAAKRPHYGYRYNEERDGYVVDEETMGVVYRIFCMVGIEGFALRGVKRTFEHEGLPTPEGGRDWGSFFIGEAIRDDIYRSHSREEIVALVEKGQMSAEVAAKLDPEKCYGIWWFNRLKTKTYQEAVNGPDGKQYKRRVKITQRPQEEWIAVPVPESGIPREWVDLARNAIAGNAKLSMNNNRPWELSGGTARCAQCGWAMRAHSVWGPKSKHVNHYYRCTKSNANYAYSVCPNKKVHRADRLEPMVWDYVSGVMKDPEQLRADLDRMIELKRRETRGSPGTQARIWADELAAVDRKRAKYQEAFAADAVTLPELKAYLAQLDETRKTAEVELAALRDQRRVHTGTGGRQRRAPGLPRSTGTRGPRLTDTGGAARMVQAAWAKSGRAC